MKVKLWLAQTIRKLQAVDIATARLDALVLLEDMTSKDRAWLLAHPEHGLSSAQVARLEKLLNRRVRHEPLAYIRGKTEFYGREFVLTPAVLEPRPESETMIDLLKGLPCFRQPKPGLDTPKKKSTGSTPDQSVSAPYLNAEVRIADVGTGSGALGVTAKLELPNSQVDLLEIDKKALAVAKKNVDKFTLNISAICSDLLAGSPADYDVLLCNLPYVPDSYTINQAATHEPRLAIFGGPDGLDVYRKLFQQITKLSKKPLYILTESLPPQHQALEAIAQHHGYHLLLTDDFIQVFDGSQHSAKWST